MKKNKAIYRAPASSTHLVAASQQRTSDTHTSVWYVYRYIWLFVLALLITSHKIGFVNIFPTHLGWLSVAGGDYTVYLTNWLYYLNEAWSFPVLGKVEKIYYPFGTSIAMSDVIPLFAIPSKFIGRWLGVSEFQYYGIWVLLNVYLMGIFSWKFFRSHQVSHPLVLLCASTLLMLSAPLSFRISMHFSLVAQWLIVACLYYYLQDFGATQTRSYFYTMCAMNVLWVLSAGISIYLMVPVFVLNALLVLRMWFLRKQLFLIGLSLMLVGGLLVWGCLYIYGFFILQGADLASLSGFGIYSTNVNSLWNGEGYAAFAKNMPLMHGQYEGFSYLGIGMWMLLFFLLVYAVYYIRTTPSLFAALLKKVCTIQIMLLLCVLLLFYIFALSEKIYLNDTLLIDMKLSQQVLAICNYLRSSGRYVWMIYYPLVLFLLLVLARICASRSYAYWIFLALVLLQVSDLSALFSPAKDEAYLSKDVDFGKLDEYGWTKIFDEHILTPVPALECLYYASATDWSKFAYLALQKGRPFNTSLVSRQDEKKKKAYIEQQIQRIRAGILQDSSEVFLLAAHFYFRGQQYANEYIHYFADIQSRFVITTKDDYYILTPKKEFFVVKPNILAYQTHTTSP